MRSKVAFGLGIFVALLAGGSAVADQTFNVTVRGRSISGITIAPASDVDGNDCDPAKLAGLDGYACKIVLSGVDDTLKEYKLILQGDDLNLPYPIMVRVYPNNNTPIRMNLDLSDPVFSHKFSLSRKYYDAWNQSDSKTPDDNLTFYLLTKNYYATLSEGVDAATAWVLHEWLRRATYMAQNVRYIGADSAVLAEIKKLPESLSPPQQAIFNKYGPKLVSPDGPTDFERLQIADWYLYRVLNETKVAPSSPFPPSLCNLFGFFKSQWTSAGKKEQATITAAWHVDSDTLTQDGSKTYLARCPANQ